jgi:threonine aldolase
MVFFDPNGTGLSNDAFLAALARQGVRMGQVRGVIRAVTHLDVTRDDIETAIAAVAAIAQSPNLAADRRAGIGQGY